MLKKIVSILLAVVLLLSVAAISVSAEEVSDSEREEQLIYFDATGWEDIRYVYCYVWELYGDAFYTWHSKVTRMTQVEGNLYSYDLSVLEDDKYIEGGMQDGKDYCIIFSYDTSTYDMSHTYDLTFSTKCIGDTAYLTGNQLENPVDANKTTYEAVWTNNSDKYGPYKLITSIGNVVGTHLGTNDSNAVGIGIWLPSYYNKSYVDATATVAKAYPEFDIKTAQDVQAIYTYIIENYLERYKLTDADFNEMAKILYDAFYMAYPSSDEVVVLPTKATEPTTEGTESTAETTEPQVTESAPTATEPEETKPQVTEPEATEPAETEPANKPTDSDKKSPTVAKKANKMKVTVTTKTVKAKKVKNAKVTVKSITVKNANGAVSYKKVAKKSSNRLTINAKTGKITVKKGTKKNTYKIQVKITAKGDKTHKPKTVTKTIKIKVK